MVPKSCQFVEALEKQSAGADTPALSKLTALAGAGAPAPPE
jgi:hypothetical protein